jgi:hypothetical protein
MLKCSEVNVTIRKAKKEDMVQVYKLIKDLAEFEKLEKQVKIDASVLVEDGFKTENPAFTCLVAELSDGHIMGYALYYISYSTWLGKSIFLFFILFFFLFFCSFIFSLISILLFIFFFVS